MHPECHGRGRGLPHAEDGRRDRWPRASTAATRPRGAGKKRTRGPRGPHFPALNPADDEGYVVTRVVRWFGGGPDGFWRQWREPYWRTLWLLAQVEEAERIEQLIRKSDDIAAAFRMNGALWDGKRLQEEQREFIAELRRDPDAKELTAAELRAMADRMTRLRFVDTDRKDLS